MLKEKLQSTNLKLYILLGIIVLLFVVFGIYFLKDYYSYYRELYAYRQRLVSALSSEQVIKPVYNVNDPYSGNPRSKIVIFEYSDFSCEACRALQPIIQEVEKFYGENNILIIWKDLPISISPNNFMAHESAHCAFEQNAFKQYKSLLFEQQGKFSKELFIALAESLNLDTAKFTECLESEKYKDTVQINFEEALRIGLDSTPSLFINNQEVQYGFNFSNLRSIIESTK